MSSNPRPSADEQMQDPDQNPAISLRIGREELVIRGRYETLSIANDVLIGVVFLIGSIFFFSEPLTVYGTWLFVIGSLLMLIRPSIRLARRVHLQRLNPENPSDDSLSY